MSVCVFDIVQQMEMSVSWVPMLSLTLPSSLRVVTPSSSCHGLEATHTYTHKHTDGGGGGEGEHTGSLFSLSLSLCVNGSPGLCGGDVRLQIFTEFKHKWSMTELRNRK